MKSVNDIKNEIERLDRILVKEHNSDLNSRLWALKWVLNSLNSKNYVYSDLEFDKEGFEDFYYEIGTTKDFFEKYIDEEDMVAYLMEHLGLQNLMLMIGQYIEDYR